MKKIPVVYQYLKLFQQQQPEQTSNYIICFELDDIKLCEILE
jgi:hypothetical protein